MSEASLCQRSHEHAMCLCCDWMPSIVAEGRVWPKCSTDERNIDDATRLQSWASPIVFKVHDANGADPITQMAAWLPWLQGLFVMVWRCRGHGTPGPVHRVQGYNPTVAELFSDCRRFLQQWLIFDCDVIHVIRSTFDSRYDFKWA